MKKLVLFALLGAATIAVNACSEDEVGNGNNKTDASSDGATSNDGSTSGETGIIEEPDSGPKTCGNDEVLAKQTTCNTCLVAQCCDAVKACQDDVACLGFFTCMKTCDAGASCQGTCVAGKSESGLKLFQALALCAGTKCSDGGIAPGCPL